jgi:HEAT repeat protein
MTGVAAEEGGARFPAAVEQLATVEGWRAAYPQLDEAGPAAREAVVRGLVHPHPRVRQWCAALLDHHADERCVPALLRLLDDPVAGVRRHALHSLGCQPCKPAPLRIDVVPLLLRRATQDTSVRVRRAAAHLLGCQPPDGRAAAGLRALAAGDPDPKVRRNAQWALAQQTGQADRAERGRGPAAGPGVAPEPFWTR